MAQEYTAKFKVDISDLKKNISEANQQIKLANATFKAETAGMEKWSDNAEGLGAKLKQLDSQLTNQKKVLSAYEQELKRNQEASAKNAKAADELKAKLQDLAAKGVKETDAEYKKYQKELTDVTAEQAKNEKACNDLKVSILNQKAAVAETEKNIRHYEDALDDLGKEEEDAEKGAKGLGKQTEDAGNKAEKADKQFGDLAGKLAGALAKGLAAVGAAAAGAVAGLAAASKSAAAYADDMLTLSTTTGMSVESLQAYSYAANLVDVSLDTLTGAMAKNIKSMSSAASGTGAAAEAYNQLGVSVTDADGNLRDSETVFWELVDAFGAMEDGTEKDALAMTVFGKSAQELKPLFAQGSEGIAALTQEAKDMGAVMSDAAIDQLGELNNSLDRMKGGAAAAKNALGTVLAPQIKDLADAGTELLGEFAKSLLDSEGDIDSFAKNAGQLVQKLANKLIQELPKLIKVGTSIVKSLGKAILDNLPLLIQSALDIITELTTALLNPENMTLLVNAAVSILTQLATFLAENVGTLVTAAIDMMIALVTALLEPDNLEKLIEAGVTLVISLATALLDNLPKLIDAAFRIIEGIVTELIKPENLAKIIEAAGKIIVALVNALIESGKLLLEDFFKIFDGIGEWFDKNVAEPISKVFKDVWDFIKKLFKDGLNAVIWVLNKAIDGINILLLPLRAIIAAVGELFGASWTIDDVAIPHIPTIMAKGGVLKKGQMGLLEGQGGEAVVPLDQNKAWIHAMASDLLADMKSQQGAAAMKLQPAGNTTNYTQIINAPKQPSRIELYRQTRNLLSYARA